MRKLLSVLVVCLMSSPAFAFQINAGVSGSWYNANKPGHGFAIEFADANACTEIDDQGCLVVYWFAYTPEGDPIFLLGTGPVDGNQADIDLGYYSGQSFGTFTPPPGQPQAWGSLHLRFSDCGSGFASYDSDFTSDQGAAYGSGNFPITRLSSVGNLGCGNAGRLATLPDDALGGIWIGKIVSRDFPNNPNNFQQSAQAVAVVRDDGEMFLSSQSRVLFTLRGMLEGSGVNRSGNFTAMAALGGALVDGSVSGPATVDVAGNAKLSIVSSTSKPGKARPGDYMEGHIEAPGLSADLLLNYQTASERPSSLERVNDCWGSWSVNGNQSALGNVSIDPDGSFSYELNQGCKVAGSLVQGAEPWNVYGANATVSDCEFSGDYSGVAMVIDVTSNVGADNGLVMALDDGERSLVSTALRLGADQCGN